jgi:hypothetical protein
MSKIVTVHTFTGKHTGLLLGQDANNVYLSGDTRNYRTDNKVADIIIPKRVISAIQTRSQTE